MLERRGHPSSAHADAALLARQEEIAVLRTVTVDLADYLWIADRRGARGIRKHALDVAHDAAVRSMCDLRAEIAAMPARTMPGLRFKASIVEPEHLDNDGATRALLLSIVADILAMDGAPRDPLPSTRDLRAPEVFDPRRPPADDRAALSRHDVPGQHRHDVSVRCTEPHRPHRDRG